MQLLAAQAPPASSLPSNVTQPSITSQAPVPAAALWVLNLKLFLFLSLFCLYQNIFSFSAIT